MRTAMGMAKTARSYTVGQKPQQVKLEAIMNQVEMIQGLVTCSEQERQEALELCWEAYGMVLQQMDVLKDESWGGAQKQGSTYRPKFPMESFDVMMEEGDEEMGDYLQE